MTTPAPTFRSEAVEAAYRREGYAVVPFLADAEVAALEEAYWRDVADVDDRLLAIDYLRPDRATMERIRELVLPLWTAHLPEHFNDHHVIFTTFVVKHPGPGSEMFLHEDRSWVDERHHRSGTLWIPLVDVGPTTDNGRLEVVPRSHEIGRYWSGSLTPDLIRPYEGWLRERLVPLEVPAGSAVYYDSRTLHASPANTSDRPRVALVCGVAPRSAPLVHVVATGTRRRAMYAVDPDFFVHHGPRAIEEAMPDGYPVIDEVDDVEGLDPLVLADVLGGDVPVPRPVVPADIDAPPTGWAPLDPAAPGPGIPAAADRPWWDVVTGRAVLVAEHVTDDRGHHRWAGELHPGARVRITTRPGDRLIVLDTPPVGAGLAVGGAAANLRDGVDVALDAGTALLWSEGPGVLRVEVARLPPAVPRAAAPAAGRPASLGARLGPVLARLRSLATGHSGR